MEHDPVKFNTLLQLYDTLHDELSLIVAKNDIEEDAAKFVKRQDIINQLKKKTKCD